jgi:predicted transcriptional regulator
MVNAKAVRVAVGLSCSKVAKLTKRSRHTVRVYEANPEAVEPEVQSDLDSFYAKLRDVLGAGRTESPPQAI